MKATRKKEAIVYMEKIDRFGKVVKSEPIAVFCDSLWADHFIRQNDDLKNGGWEARIEVRGE